MPPLRFEPLGEASARQIAAWKYNPPYDFYDITEDAVDGLIDPCNQYFGIFDDHDQLIGYCSFGIDGQVPGGDYSQDALDIGLNMRPDHNSKGKGAEYANLVINFAKIRFKPTRLRVAIAEFNQRAQKVWRKQGFEIEQHFLSAIDHIPFVILARTA